MRARPYAEATPLRWLSAIAPPDGIATYPAKKKSAEDIKSAVNDLKGSETIRRWYSDGAPELHAVCRELGIRHDISDPHRSETNGAIERTNRTAIEGTRCILFQSGMPYKYWKMAIKCFAANYNTTHVDAKKGTVSYVERHSTCLLYTSPSPRD